MKPSFVRTRLLVFSLVTIILSSFSFTWFFIEWNFAYFSFILLCLVSMMRLKKIQLAFGLIVSFVIANWLLIIHRAAYIEPVWLIWPPLWLVSSITILSLVIFFRHFHTRIYSLIGGVFQGIILTSMMNLIDPSLSVERYSGIESLFVLDVLSLSICSVICWTKAETVAKSLKENYIHSSYRSVQQNTKMNA